MSVPPTHPGFPPPAPPKKPDNSSKIVVLAIAGITAIAAICCIGVIAINNTPDHPTPTTSNKIADALDDDTGTPTEAATTPDETLETLEYTGSGDDVITLDNNIDVMALLTFECRACTANVIVKAGTDLIVNNIDAYTGTHLINTRMGDTTDDITITANHDWTLTIEDLTKAPRDTYKGEGPAVTIHTTTYTKAAITHQGSSNLIIHTYNETGADLALNHIGDYTGTIPINAPAIISIHADGEWTITPK